MSIRVLSIEHPNIGVTLFLINHDYPDECNKRCIFRDFDYCICKFQLILSNSSTSDLMKEVGRSLDDNKINSPYFKLCNNIFDKNGNLIIGRYYNYIAYALPSSVSLYMSKYIDKIDIKSHLDHVQNSKSQ